MIIIPGMVFTEALTGNDECYHIVGVSEQSLIIRFGGCDIGISRSQFVQNVLEGWITALDPSRN